ncbi:hypothetical protein [Methanofollis sp. UBA420]|uniref:hypothetical protein n=1 Tax=Methanofollis sp. UBA420 TaxID=1915514 RepID=UPI00316ADEEE
MSQKTRMFHTTNESNRDNDESEKFQTDEKDRYIYELVSKRYDEESDRLNRLDGKASQIIAIGGIILSLEAGFLNNIVEQIPYGSGYYIITRMILLASLLSLVTSIGLSLKAYSIKTVRAVPDPGVLLSNYTGDEVSFKDVLIQVTKELNNAVSIYKGVNDKKAKDTKHGLYALGLGIIAYFIFGIGILFL